MPAGAGRPGTSTPPLPAAPSSTPPAGGAHDEDGTRYLCEGSPAQVANTLAGYQSPAARASNAGSQYLRYDDPIVSVGPDGPHPCSIRVEDLSAGYSHGAFIFLGPGFYPGSPSSGAGGSSGGPGGTK